MTAILSTLTVVLLVLYMLRRRARLRTEDDN
jgi:hypothetical protein